MNELKIKFINTLKENIKKKKEILATELRNCLVARENSIENRKPISERSYVPESGPKNSNGSEHDNPLKVQKNFRETNSFFDIFKDKDQPVYKYTYKDANGKKIENPSVDEVNTKHSDGEILDFVINIKSQRHITKSSLKGKNLDSTQDDIVNILSNSREAFSNPESLEQVQKILIESLKVSEARGVVVNKLHVIFQDYSNVNLEKLEKLGINAVSLSSVVSVDKKDSPNAEIICHSSLYKSSPNSFNHALEVANAKKISVIHNTTVFVTGDVPLNDPEIQKFIGNRKLVILDTNQTNFDYYFFVTKLNGEEVVIRGDLKNRPIERVDNLGELKNSDAYTFIYSGQPENDNMLNKKLDNYCDNQEYLLNEKLELLKSESDSFDSEEYKRKISVIELQLKQIELFRLSHDVKHLDSFEGAKPLFYDFVERKNGDKNLLLVEEPNEDWYDPELARRAVSELD